MFVYTLNLIFDLETRIARHALKKKTETSKFQMLCRLFGFNFHPNPYHRSEEALSYHLIILHVNKTALCASDPLHFYFFFFFYFFFYLKENLNKTHDLNE